MIYNAAQIEEIVSKCSGTWVKRRNLRSKLVLESNNEVNNRISKVKAEIRALKACGVKEQALSPVYAKITQLELKILEK